MLCCWTIYCTSDSYNHTKMSSTSNKTSHYFTKIFLVRKRPEIMRNVVAKYLRNNQENWSCDWSLFSLYLSFLLSFNYTKLLYTPHFYAPVRRECSYIPSLEKPVRTPSQSQATMLPSKLKNLFFYVFHLVQLKMEWI